MSETITIEPGTRIKIDGQRYATVTEAVVDATELSPVAPLPNPWKPLVCPVPACQAWQREHNRGRLIVARMTPAVDGPRWEGKTEGNTVRCKCGVCDARMVPQSEVEPKIVPVE